MSDQNSKESHLRGQERLPSKNLLSNGASEVNLPMLVLTSDPLDKFLQGVFLLPHRLNDEPLISFVNFNGRVHTDPGPPGQIPWYPHSNTVPPFGCLRNHIHTSF